MKKTMVIAALGFATVFSVAMMSSCKKDKAEKKDQILGLWHVSYMGTDQNKNGSLEESEKTMVPDTSEFTFQFVSGGTGETVVIPSMTSGISTTVPFTWTINNEGSVVTVIANGKTSVVSLITLSSSLLNGVYEDNGTRTWIYATK